VRLAIPVTSLPELPHRIGDARDGLHHAQVAITLAAVRDERQLHTGLGRRLGDLLGFDLARGLAQIHRGTPRANRFEQPRAIGRQILRRAGPGIDHGGEIARAELVDRGLRDAPRGIQRLAVRNRAIHQNDHQPAFLGQRIGRDVRHHVAHPRRGRLRLLGKIDEREGHDRPRMPVFEQREVAGRQTGDGLAVFVEDGDVDLNEIGPGTERRLGWHGLLCPAGARHGQGAAKRDGDRRAAAERGVSRHRSLTLNWTSRPTVSRPFEASSESR